MAARLPAHPSQAHLTDRIDAAEKALSRGLSVRYWRRRAEPSWTGAFAAVAAVTTLALLAVGGLVTSHRAGLAVVDWPNSFGYNIFSTRSRA